MEYALIVYNEAKEDILEIVKWYDLKSIELSNRFMMQLDEAMNKLSVHPNSFSYLYGAIRRIQLQKFPYIIFYQVKQQNVHIYGIVHTKRKPGVYKKRLKKLL